MITKLYYESQKRGLYLNIYPHIETKPEGLVQEQKNLDSFDFIIDRNKWTANSQNRVPKVVYIN